MLPPGIGLLQLRDVKFEDDFLKRQMAEDLAATLKRPKASKDGLVHVRLPAAVKVMPHHVCMCAA